MPDNLCTREHDWWGRVNTDPGFSRGRRRSFRALDPTAAVIETSERAMNFLRLLELEGKKLFAQGNFREISVK